MTEALLHSETPLVIVISRASGSRSADHTSERMRAIFTEAGRKHTFFWVDDPKRLGEVAARAVDAANQSEAAVVVAGGDGTINKVASAVLPSGRPFGIVPHGTFNLTSRAHRIPLDPETTVRALLRARLEPMQVGAVNDRLFLVNASLGLYPVLLQDREVYKRRYGRRRITALWSALHTLAGPKPELTLELQHDQAGERVHTSTLFVGNNPLQLARVGLPEAEAIGQQRLAAVVVPPLGTWPLFVLGVRGALGRLGSSSHVRDFTFERMVVSPSGKRRARPLKVAIDGEICWMQPPLTFSVTPRPLQLMVPAEQP